MRNMSLLRSWKDFLEIGATKISPLTGLGWTAKGRTNKTKSRNGTDGTDGTDAPFEVHRLLQGEPAVERDLPEQSMGLAGAWMASA